MVLTVADIERWDAGSVRDFQAFAKQTGNELVEQQTTGADFIHVLRRR